MGLFRKSPHVAPRRAEAAYAAILAASRRPEFYSGCGVADTLDGRFDVLCVHAFLALRRIKAIGTEEAAALGQAIFDTMFLDLDAALRQLGVSDIRIGKEVKKLAKAFLGRVAAYDAGLAGDGAGLAEAIARNVFRGEGENTVAVAALTQYMVDAETALAAQTDDDIVAGAFAFPEIAVEKVSVTQ